MTSVTQKLRPTKPVSLIATKSIPAGIGWSLTGGAQNTSLSSENACIQAWRCMTSATAGSRLKCRSTGSSSVSSSETLSLACCTLHLQFYTFYTLSEYLAPPWISTPYSYTMPKGPLPLSALSLTPLSTTQGHLAGSSFSPTPQDQAIDLISTRNAKFLEEVFLPPKAPA